MRKDIKKGYLERMHKEVLSTGKTAEVMRIEIISNITISGIGKLNHLADIVGGMEIEDDLEEYIADSGSSPIVFGSKDEDGVMTLTGMTRHPRSGKTLVHASSAYDSASFFPEELDTDTIWDLVQYVSNAMADILEQKQNENA